MSYVLFNLNLCILNDGTNTYLHPGSGSYSSVDLPIVDPSLLLDLHWTIHVHDLCGSDHFPIIVEGNDPLKNDCTENSKPTGPYSKVSACGFSSREFESQTDPIQQFTEPLISIANKCIPKSSKGSKRI